jgi:four helix bundle protein
LTGFENLEVWKKSIILVKEVYILVKFFPKEESYALSDQVRRCAVSVPSNIAEGSGRNSPKEFVQFLYIALGSINELETQLIIAKEIGYLKDIEEIRNKILEIKKMLNSLITSIKRKHGN